MTHLSYIELSRENARHNIAEFRRLLAPGTQIAAVVKGNAYGHGMKDFVTLIESDVDCWQVDDLLELRELRRVSGKRTLVLGYVAKDELQEALSLGGELAVYDMERLPLIDALAREQELKPRVHLKIDTFLGRQGVLIECLDGFLQELTKHAAVELAGVYSHFANIEDTSDFSHAQLQVDTFYKAVERVRGLGWPDVATHLSSTSGVLAFERDEGHNLLVRIGIGAYGLWPSEQLRLQSPGIELRPVLRWITHVAQVKTVPADYPIGYGLTYRTKAETQVAIVPQGYSDGFRRDFSNNGEVLIRGVRCPVIGRVAMNMFMVDVSALPGLRAEEEVVLLGRQGDESITAEELASRLGTINYEVTTQISPSLPRAIA